MDVSKESHLADHPVVAQLNILKSAFERVQGELYRNSVKLQSQYLQASNEHDRIHQLEQENKLLKEEVEILRQAPHPSTHSQSHPAVAQVRQLTLSLRKLSDQLSSTEERLLARTSEVVQAKSEAIKAKLGEGKAYELAARIRGREETGKQRERELEWKLRRVHEEVKMSDVAVKEYANLVRSLETKMGRRISTSSSSSSGESLQPSYQQGSTAAASPAKVLGEGLAEGLWGLKQLMGEMEGEIGGLHAQIQSLQSENEALAAKLEAQVTASEADRTARSQAEFELNKLNIEDNTATKMVSRYMKFSQTQTDILQTSMSVLTTRHAATIDTLSSQVYNLNTQTRTSQNSLERFQAALDELGGEIMKESFGRRNEVALRIRMISREERFNEALQRWIRRSEESFARLSPQDDPEGYKALVAMTQEAKQLLASLDAPVLHPLGGDDDDGGKAIVVSGSLGRLVTAQYLVDQMKAELQHELSSRLKMRRIVAELGGELPEEFLPEDQWVPPDNWMAEAPKKRKRRSAPKLGSGMPVLVNGHSKDAELPTKEAEVVLEELVRVEPPPVPPGVISPRAQEVDSLLLELEELGLEALDVRTSVDGDDATPLVSAAVNGYKASQLTPTALKTFEDAIQNAFEPAPPSPAPSPQSTSTPTLKPDAVGLASPPVSVPSPLPESPRISVSSNGAEVQSSESTLIPLLSPSPIPSSLLSESSGIVVPSDDAEEMSEPTLTPLPSPSPIPYVSDEVEMSSSPASQTPPPSSIPILSISPDPTEQATPSLDEQQAEATESGLSTPSVTLEHDLTSISSSTSPSSSPAIPQTQLPKVEHPLLQKLSESSHRYDDLQRSFRDCHLSLQSLKETLASPPLPGQTPSFVTFPSLIPQEILEAVLERLNDFVEDARVELEIRKSDEALLAKGYETLLTIPGALTVAMNSSKSPAASMTSPLSFLGLQSPRGGNPGSTGDTSAPDMEDQIAAFINGSDPSVIKAKESFGRKLEDAQHDIAALKMAIHDPESALRSPVPPPQSPLQPRQQQTLLRTSTSEASTGCLYPTPRYPGNAEAAKTKADSSWGSWLRNAGSSATPPPHPPASPTTFGNIMTSPRLRHSPSLTSTLRKSNAAAANGDNILSSLDLRIPMPKFTRTSAVAGVAVGGPTGMGPSGSGNTFNHRQEFNGGIAAPISSVAPRTRTISTMYMLGLGAGRGGPPIRHSSSSSRLGSSAIGVGGTTGGGAVGATRTQSQLNLSPVPSPSSGGGRSGSARRQYEHDIDGDTDLESDAESGSETETETEAGGSDSDLE